MLLTENLDTAEAICENENNFTMRRFWIWVSVIGLMLAVMTTAAYGFDARRVWVPKTVWVADVLAFLLLYRAHRRLQKSRAWLRRLAKRDPTFKRV